MGVRGQLNPRRRALVHMAFNVADSDGSGELTIDDLRGVYNASAHPEVIANKKTEEDVLLELLANFDVGGVKDNVVTLQEFESYYSNISAFVDNDDYFELMIRNAWHISGGKGWCENTANRRVLITNPDGTQKVEEIKNDLKIKQDDKIRMKAQLKVQGVDVAALEVYGKVDNTTPAPKPRKGLVEKIRDQTKPIGVPGAKAKPKSLAELVGGVNQPTSRTPSTTTSLTRPLSQQIPTLPIGALSAGQ